MCLPLALHDEELESADINIVKRERPVQKGELLFRTGVTCSSHLCTALWCSQNLSLFEMVKNKITGFHLAVN